ncbi:Pcs60p [Sugiyamaella lignohabitans]|uniref:Pcs60p n=1 Tax=Sugiyamaella lignohabitans TaxID=796027 RepID=A0A161HLB7_9ASCO|nr:Pcs60p [Sugiyamaella lignohabitans]ANB14077.1 Pcs60p [Sugiyamaella lignohabitans]
MSTFQEQISRSAKESEAISIPGGPSLSYSQLLTAVRSFQKTLASINIPEKSAISISLPNSIEFAIAFLGTTASSFIAAPLNPNYKESEFAFYIEDVKSSLVIVPKGSFAGHYPAIAAAKKFNAAVAEAYWLGDKIVLDLKYKGKLSDNAHSSIPPSPNPSDVAFVLHTSGTTGRPKAVPLTHANMARTVTNIINTYKLSPKDRSYLVMPLFHVHGLLAGFLAPLGSGGAVIIPPKFSAHAFWNDFLQYQANWYTAVPTIHQILLKSDLPSPVPYIRFIRSCSSSLAPSTFHALEKTFKAPVLEAYAMTEACHQMTSNNLPPGKRKPGTVGVGQGVEIAILDANGNKVKQGQEGEISIKGSNVTPGYINNPKANEESFTKDGYFRTGDQGKLDEDGFVIITGRIKELINRGGEKISPIELDGVMLEHPAVAEAVSFAAPDEMYGQVVNAAIVLKPGAKATEKDIQDFLSSKLSKFKIPQRIFFTKIMPKTATGKIQRRVIASTFLEQNKAKL